MDWPRAVVLAMITVVCACYATELWRVVCRVRVWHPAIRGRAALCLGIILASAAGAHGLVSLWGEPLTVRTPLWAAAALCFAYGYLHMANFMVAYDDR